MNTLLIGPRGCGKTAIGRRLADACGRPFVDLDERVLESFGLPSVRQVWAVHGESAWRTAEVEELRRVLGSDGLIVALGGGTPVIDAARSLIEDEQKARRARVVYLKCEVAELARRLGAGAGDRPSLTGGDVVEEIAHVLAQRRPVYEDLADLILEAGDRDEVAVTASLVAAVREEDR